FLNSLASYLLERDGGLQTEAKRSGNKPTEEAQPSAYKPTVAAFPKTHPIIREPGEIVDHAQTEFLDTLARMSAFKDLEIKKLPRTILVQFPKKIFGGRRLKETDLVQLKAVHN